MNYTKCILIACLALLLGISAQSQTSAEKGLLKEGNKLFENGHMLDALPKFRQLVSISPTDREYNFKYGACLLSSDEKELAVKHLKFSVKGGGGDPLAHYYLGKAYHIDYQFSEAVKEYKRFQGLADSKLQEEYPDTERLIAMAENGKNLLSSIKDITVLDRNESTVADFFRSYDMEDIGGRVITLPEELLTSQDKKKEHRPLIHFPADGTEILFSSYGSGEDLDIYSTSRLASGEFTDPVRLEGAVNTEYDEDYPFMHSDGKTLYFSSKGHNSMGGYDVFSAERGEDGWFSEPKNLDFAISSPDDDIFYMVGADGRLANFASNRGQEDGRLNVYKVAVKNATMSLAIIKGEFQNETGGSRVATINVINASTNEEIGSYQTNGTKGDYLIDLPKAGKYKFYIDAEDSEVTHTGMVDIPSVAGMQAFKQEMTLVEVAGAEKLIIKNLFDEPLEEDILALAQELLKRKAKLDVNSDGTEELPVITELDEEHTVQSAGFAEGTSLDEVLDLADQQQVDLEKSLEDTRTDSEKILALAKVDRDKATEFSIKAARSYAKIEDEEDEGLREELIIQTASLRDRSAHHRQEAEVALRLLDDLEKDEKNKRRMLEEMTVRNATLDQAVSTKDASLIVEQLDDVKAIRDKAGQQDALDYVSSKAIDRKQEAERTLRFADGMRSEEEELQARLATRKTQLGKVSKSKEKEAIQADISAIESELTDYDAQIKKAFDKLEKIQSESDLSGRSVRMLEKVRVGGVDEEIETMPIIPVTIEAKKEIDGNLRQIVETNDAIALSGKDVRDIFVKRPDLRDNYMEELAMTGADVDTNAFDRLPTDASITSEEDDSKEPEEVADISRTDELAEKGEADAVETQTSVDTSTADQETEEDVAEGAEPDVSSTTDPDTVARSEEGSEHDASSEVDSEVDEEKAMDGTASSSAPDVTDTDARIAEDEVGSEQIASLIERDYAALSSEELLTTVDADYAVKKEDIARADLNERMRAAKQVDLNQQTIRTAEGQITELSAQRWDADEAGRKQIDGNVSRLQTLVLDLQAENERLKEETIASTGSVDDRTAEAGTEVDGEDGDVENAAIDRSGDGSPAGSKDTEESTDSFSTIGRPDLAEMDADLIADETIDTSAAVWEERADNAQMHELTAKSRELLTVIDQKDIGKGERAAERMEVNATYLQVADMLRVEKEEAIVNSPSKRTQKQLTEEVVALEDIILLKEKELAQDRQILRRGSSTITEEDFMIAEHSPSYIKERLENERISVTLQEREERFKHQDYGVLLDLKSRSASSTTGDDPFVAIALLEERVGDYEPTEDSVMVGTENTGEADTELAEDGASSTMEDSMEEVRTVESEMEDTTLNSDTEETMDSEDVTAENDIDSAPVNLEKADEWDLDYAQILETEGLRKAKFRSLKANMAYPSMKADILRMQENKDDNDQASVQEVEVGIGQRIAETTDTEFRHYVDILSRQDKSRENALDDRADALEKSAMVYMEQADRYRIQSDAQSDLALKNAMLKKAVAMELTAVDQLSEALVIYKHLDNGGTDDDYVVEDVILEQEVPALADVTKEMDVLPHSNAAVTPLTVDTSVAIADGQPEEVDDEVARTTTSSESSTVESEVEDSSESTTEKTQMESSDGISTANTDSMTGEEPENGVGLETPSTDTEEDLSDSGLEDAGAERTDLADTGIDGLEETDLADAEADDIVELASTIRSIEDVEQIQVMSVTRIREVRPATVADLRASEVPPIDEVAVERPRPTQGAVVEYIERLDDPELNAMDEEGKEEVASSLIVWEELLEDKEQMVEQVKTYRDERKKRKVALAEVVDVRSEDAQGTAEKQRLISEIQVLDAYIAQGDENISELNWKMADIQDKVEGLRSASAPVATEVVVTTEADSSVDPADTEASAPDMTGAGPDRSVVSGPALSPDAAIFEIPEVLIKEKFVADRATTTYSEANPIPVNISLPDGLVYQVQVGAYRNPIPPDVFQGFAPIIGTRLESGITRYTVGLFMELNTASRAKGQVRQLGYDDAFVVAFMDGRRITIGEANAIAAGMSSETAGETTASTSGIDRSSTADTRSDDGASTTSSDDGTTTAATSDEDRRSDVQSTSDGTVDNDRKDGATGDTSGESTTATDATDSEERTTEENDRAENATGDGLTVLPDTRTAVETTDDNTTDPMETESLNVNEEEDIDPTAYYTEAMDAAPATQVEVLKGLFYTVQVGVYSKPVSSSAIFDLSPLNSELLRDGLIKYTSGIFNDISDASQWKEQVVQRGVGDAFVTAYYNGKRITMSRADRLRSEQGNTVLIAAEDLTDVSAEEDEPAVWELVSTSELFDSEADDLVTFKIRMGPYYDRIPDDEVKVILDFEDQVEFSQTDEGAFIYNTKNAMTYNEARAWKATYLERGIRNANIVAFEGAKEIPVKQALEILLK